jgi:hypothetical protein
MFSTSPSMNAMGTTQYLVYTTAIIIVAFGIYKAKGIIIYFLDQLYKHFIQNNPSIQ